MLAMVSINLDSSIRMGEMTHTHTAHTERENCLQLLKFLSQFDPDPYHSRLNPDSIKFPRKIKIWISIRISIAGAKYFNKIAGDHHGSKR